METIDIVVYCGYSLMILFAVVMIFGGISSSYLIYARDKSCEHIDMKFKKIMNADYCIDNFNNAHLVDIVCSGFLFDTKCTANIITIGTFRTVVG